MSNCTPKWLAAQTVEEAMAQHDGLVHAFIQRQGGGAISYEEALQAGRIGLWHALQGYDPARGTAFSTYAWVAIYRRIHRRAQELSQETEVLLAEIAGSWVLPDPAEELEKRLIHDALHELVSQLPSHLWQVVEGRFGLGARPPCTLKELGQELGLSGERVRQLEQDALAWLRHPAHSGRLRQLLGKNTAADYRCALAQNAALRRARRKRR